MEVNVGVATTSELKVEAVLAAFKKFFSSVILNAKKVPSDIDEQPVGYELTITGAQNRIKHLRELLPLVNDKPQVDFYVGIENGLIPIPGPEPKWLDVGWVIVIDARTEKQYCTSSGGLLFDKKYVEGAKEIGWKTMTAGELMSKELNCDPKDPHSFITNKRVSRRDLLIQAVCSALGEWERDNK